MHDAAFRPRLVRDEAHAQHLLGDLESILGILGDLDAAALATATGMDLGLHHRAGVDPPGGGLSFLGGVDHFSPRHRESVLRQDGLGLILMDFHREAPMLGSENNLKA